MNIIKIVRNEDLICIFCVCLTARWVYIFDIAHCIIGIRWKFQLLFSNPRKCAIMSIQRILLVHISGTNCDSTDFDRHFTFHSKNSVLFTEISMAYLLVFSLLISDNSADLHSSRSLRWQRVHNASIDRWYINQSICVLEWKHYVVIHSRNARKILVTLFSAL